MRYILLKLSDEATEKFVAKAGAKALGVWEVPTHYCDCETRDSRFAANWEYDPLTQRSYCKKCRGPHKPVTKLGERLRIAMLSRNIIKLYRR